MKYAELQVKLILNSCGVTGFPKYLLAESELISFTKFTVLSHYSPVSSLDFPELLYE